MIELPEALRAIYDRFAQRGARVIAAWPQDRDVTPALRRWRVDGMEFADEEIARGADYRRHTFTLHVFEDWDRAEVWLRGDGSHEHGDLLGECPDCADARRDYKATFDEVEWEGSA